MHNQILDHLTGRQYPSMQEYWKDKYYAKGNQLNNLKVQSNKIKEFQRICAENQKLRHNIKQLQSIVNFLKVKRSEQETQLKRQEAQLNKLQLFINKFADLIKKREPLIHEYTNQKISLGKMQSALQKIIAELMYYEAFAIKTTIDKTKVKTVIEENACNYFNCYTKDFYISDKQRYLNYQDEQRRIGEVVQKYKDKSMRQSLLKHSEILNDMYSHSSKVSAQVEEAKKIINQIKDNIDSKKTYITYSNCSLYALFNELMSKVSTLYYPTSTTHTAINKNTSNTFSSSYSSFYSIMDGVKYDRLTSFVDKLYQDMLDQSEGYKTRGVRLSEKIQFIEEKSSSQQCYYQKETRQQVEAYASKINQLVPQMLEYLGKQAASGTTALHVFTFELADIDSIMSQIKNKQQISIASHPLKQIERIQLYLKDSIHTSQAYLRCDKSLLELQSISEMVRCYCEPLKKKVNQLHCVLDQKKRSALLNEAKKQADTASDEVHQMNTQLLKENQLLLASNKNLECQLIELHQQHTKQIHKKDEKIEQLYSSIRTLENDLATREQQTKIEVEAIKNTKDQKRKELEQLINSLREKLQSDKKAFDQTLTKKQEQLHQQETQLRKEIDSLHLTIYQMEAQYQETISKSNQSHALQMQHLHKQHSTTTELKNSQVLNLSNKLQSLQQVYSNCMQLTREKYQLQLANQHLLAKNQHLSGQIERIKTDQQRYIRSNEEEKQQALSLMAAEYASRIKQLCNDQNNDQLKTLSDAYQRQAQSLRKLINQKEQHLILMVQERNDLQLNSYQMSLKIEQLISQRKNEQEERIKFQQSATLQMQKLIGENSKTVQQLQQQEKELAEIRLQLQRTQAEKQLIYDQNIQLTANTHKLEVQFQDRVREIQHECDQKLQSLSQQTQKYQHQIHELAQINSQLLQKQQAEMREQCNMRQQLDQLSHGNKYYCAQLRQKQQEIQKLKIESIQLRDSCQQLETENIVRMNEIADLRRNIQTQEQQKKQQQEQLANQQRQHTQQHIQLTSQITQLTHQLKIVQQKQIATAEREAKANHQLKQLQNTYQELTRQHEDITQKYLQAAEKYEQLLSEQIGKNMHEVSKISEAVGNSFIDNADQEKIKELQHLLKQKQQQFENNFARYRKQSEQEISALKQKNKQLENQNRSLQQKNELIEAETQSIAAQIGALQEEIKSLRDNEKYYRNSEQQLQTEINNLNATMQLQKQEMQKLQPIIDSQKQEIAKLKQQKIKNSSPHKSAPLPLIEDTLMVPYTNSLFNEDIFAHDQIHKTVLVSHIEKYIQSRIARTRLLHKYDPKNKLNFHLYIDEVPTLCVVIKTKNAIISGLYPGTLRDKEILDKGGLLVSVTNDNSYRLFAKKPGDPNKTLFRGMIYDTFFAIFGNAEIRVKSGFKTVFSNFGVSNGYFNSQGDKINKFLNEGDKREVQFEYCQFYQVLFEQPIEPASFIPSA